jgi:hypothetical protein
MPIIKRNSVHFDDRPAAAGPATPRALGRAVPAQGVRLLRAEGVVRAIEVTCACGEVTVIELSYDDVADDAASDLTQEHLS